MRQCTMEMIYFKDYAELGEYLYSLAADHKTVSTVLFKKDIIGLLRWIMEYDDIELSHIEIKDKLLDNYSKEYYFTIDDDFSVTVVPVYDRDTDSIIPCYSDIILFNGDVSSKIAIENDNCVQIEISVTDYDSEDSCGDCCCDCSNCQKAMTSQAISSALSFIDYIFNHYND